MEVLAQGGPRHVTATLLQSGEHAPAVQASAWLGLLGLSSSPVTDHRIALGDRVRLITSTGAQDTAAGNAREPLVVNGCPIWPYAWCRGADLRHANLAGQDLAGADLSGANLSRADLRGANLAGAVLDGADLTATRLNKVNAPAASFKGARMVAADLEFARVCAPTSAMQTSPPPTWKPAEPPAQGFSGSAKAARHPPRLSRSCADLANAWPARAVPAGGCCG